MAIDSVPSRRHCGTMKVHRRLLDSDPGYARRLARIEENAFRARFSLSAMRTGCTEIPVVVHVVHNDPAEDISMAQINSQIEVLNRDFRKQNADISTVPAPFAPLAGDARIQFRLATEDPNGKPTDGVTRTPTKVNGFDGDDAVKFDKQGGKNAWPSDQYLNIWVCKLAGGLLGYAQFPGGAAETDGVVVLHTAFGTTGTAAAPFNLGRTTTHEIAHWLNLRHIWGDDGEGCSGSDFVDDTPNQGGGNIGKPIFPHISCNNGPHGDMFMNFMDYVDDDTMVMFSEGQIQRMQACLDGPRSAIGTSVSCTGDVVKPAFKEGSKEFPKDPGKEGPKDPDKDPLKEGSKDPFKDGTKDPHKDPLKEGPKDPIKDPFKDGPKDPLKEPMKESGKDWTKDPGFDPKPFPGDPGKGPFDPPKSPLEPPIGPIAPPSFPTPPTGPFGGGSAQPFVLATGGPPGSNSATMSYRAHYESILAQYAELHQRGMLDQQGLNAWQQIWAAYQRASGQ